MKSVLFDFFHAHRLKCTQADVQCNFGGFNAALLHAIESLGREVQAGGRSSYRTAFTGIDGLVAIPVPGLVFSGNVGRQRNMAEFFQSSKKVRDRLEAKAA